MSNSVNITDCLNISNDSIEISNGDTGDVMSPNNIEDISDIVVGIDLGTTNSCISIWRNNNLEIIPDKNGNRTIPSAVAFTKKSRYIGSEAKKQIEINPTNTFYEVKRLIGRKYSDETVQNDMNFMTYNIECDGNNNILLSSDIKKYTPEEISSIILTELKHMAENYLKCPIEKAVITVPAYFNDAQRQATRDAATIAGLDCIRIINEPTAAALAYGLERLTIDKNKDLNIIVYDLGGGTLDVSLLNISNGLFQVLGSSGNTHLGGADFDNKLINFCINEFKKKYNYNSLDNLNSVSFQKLKQSCEEAKKRLSNTSTNKTVIAVKDFYDSKNLFISMTNELFRSICKDLFILCLKPIEDVLISCDMQKEHIDEIILVGGATRMPTIQENIKLFFNGKSPNASINPDEVVSAGASLQGFILSHNTDPFSENIVLLDVTPLSLGVETIGGVMNMLIPRNSVIPITKKRKYTTDTDYETSVNIKVFEGERSMTKDNFLVGEFELTNIESAPRGIPQIEITFSVDVNGIVNVSAMDLKNNDNHKIININSNKGRLTPEKIKELVECAKNAELTDKLEREKKQYYYEIDDLCSNIMLNINDTEYKLKDDDKQHVETDIKNIMTWLQEKTYCDRDKKEYLTVIERLKKNYGTLILKATHELDKIKAQNVTNKMELTTVYGNEEEDETIYEQLENEEFGINNEDTEVKNEIKRLREMLVSLCYSLFDIVSSESLNIPHDETANLKEYIDDTLLWTHVKEKITIAEYKQKIDEINTMCNVIVEKYNNNLFVSNDDNNVINIKIKRQELEQLCYMLMSSIISNVLALGDDKTLILKNKITNTLDWLIEIDVNIKKAELSKTTFIVTEEMYNNKIAEINYLCDELYNSMIEQTINNKQ